MKCCGNSARQDKIGVCILYNSHVGRSTRGGEKMGHKGYAAKYAYTLADYNREIRAMRVGAA